MKTFPKKLRFWTAFALALLMSVYHVSPVAAALAPSRTSGTTAIGSIRDADMLVAQRSLENKIVAQKLRDYGVGPGDVQLRLAGMSDQDLHTLASASKGLPSGADGTTGALIGILVVVILVIVILRLMHHDVVVR
jgi:hypothetical protein